MTGEFPPSGEGLPTVAQVLETRDYLLRHNRKAGCRPTQAELLANGFNIGVATVQRWLKGKVPKEPSMHPIAKKERIRRERAKGLNRAEAPKPPPVTSLTEGEIDLLKEIIGDDKSEEGLKKNCDIALLENKVRMALNIILMKRMIAKPELLMLDMRGAAALVDALTVSSKVSGGAAFEVLAPGEKPEANGAGMKDITPNQNVASIEAFERFRLNGKRA